MKGNIYSREKCSICGGKLQHVEKRNGCFCKKHPEISARRFYVRFDTVFKNFLNYEQAAQFLSGLRFKTVEGTYDSRDYQKDKPFGFTSLSDKYLARKTDRKSFSNIKNYIIIAQEYFGQKNIKEINGADIEDFLFQIPDISEKTRHNYGSTLHDFFKYCLRRGVINLSQMPIFPEIKFSLAYRNYTDWETQGKILSEIHKLTADINPKIHLYIEFLATYIALRPDDLRRVKEGDFDFRNAVLIIRRPTKTDQKPKVIRLIPEHLEKIEQLKNQFPGLPTAPFFRHNGNVKKTQVGQEFGKQYIRRWWHRACNNLGIENLDMYGGTRHTTTTELARSVSSEVARKASDHQTNKAFDRYCQAQDSTALEAAKIVAIKRGKLIDLFGKTSHKTKN